MTNGNVSYFGEQVQDVDSKNKSVKMTISLPQSSFLKLLQLSDNMDLSKSSVLALALSKMFEEWNEVNLAKRKGDMAVK